jgi:hypothetical protein
MSIAESEKNIHEMNEAEFEKHVHEMAGEVAKKLTLRGEGNFHEIPDTSLGKAIQKGHREGLEIRVDNIARSLQRKVIANS